MMKRMITWAMILAIGVAAAGCGSGGGTVLDGWADRTEGFDGPRPDGSSDLPGGDAEQLCVPGSRSCVGDKTYRFCNETGSGYVPGGECSGNTACYGGACLDPCAIADQKRSSVGCVYYAVDTNPIHETNPGDFAVGISNTNETQTANVLVETKNGAAWSTVAGGALAVRPLSLQTLVLPHRFVKGSALYAGGAYRITSDLPIIAYQFNPMDGSQSYLSDASLLLPKSSLDTYHLVEAWPQGPADESNEPGWPAHIQIAAAGETDVRVTSTINTAAGSGVPALTIGVPQAFHLTEGDFLQLDVLTHMDSFAGTYIESDGPVAVFSSNDCANVPASLSWCCCEHLEEQLFGLQRWGKSYVGSRITARGPEPVVWTIVASEDNTTIRFDYDPIITGVPAALTMNRGERQMFQSNGPAEQPGDFLLTADKPVLLTQYMVAAFMVEAGGNNGDPSMVQAVPVDQYLDRYVVLVPATWQNDYLVLTRSAGSQISVDGTPVTGAWVAVGNSSYEVFRMLVPDGVHVVEGTAPFGIIVVGYDAFDSYAYPGGLNLQLINPII